MNERNYLIDSRNNDRPVNKQEPVRTIYYAEVISCLDPEEGGKIKVKIPGLDIDIANPDLAFCEPMLPRYFHNIPKVGETVRIIIDDPRFPQQGRHWVGPVIPQLPKVDTSDWYTSTSTTGKRKVNPDKPPSSFPEAKGVYPELSDIGLIGRDNTDIILREKEIELRAGKHIVDNNLQLNKKNPSYIRLNISENGETGTSLMVADRIAIISHSGVPKFKAIIDDEEIIRIFEKAHPLGRGDRIVKALESLRNAIKTHIHGYNGEMADVSGAIADLENLDFNQILQNNIRIN